MDRRVAFVTGASRGIGKASALALARAGFDVVAAGRSVNEGERLGGSAAPGASGIRTPPGSLDATAQAVRELERDALTVRLDPVAHDSITRAVDETFERWGRIDLLLCAPPAMGPAAADRLLDLPIEALREILHARVLAPVALTQLVLPHMLQRGSGILIHLTAGDSAEGSGPGFGGAAAEAALERLVGILAREHGDSGVRFHNLDPGPVSEEGSAQPPSGIPAEVSAAVVAWLATDPEAERWSGRTLRAPELAAERGLVPGWP